MTVSLDDVRGGWDAAAQRDAMGYILTSGQAWDADTFFAHGRAEIADCFRRLDDLGLRGGEARRALDFGCGIGRLTQALADYYDRVDGVDLAPAMIEQANAHNRHGARVRYKVTGERLPYRAATFDLIYTMIVLQHMPQPFAHQYIRDFIRMLRPGGLAVFEIPEGPDTTHAEACLSMYATSRETVEQVVGDAGGEVVDAELLPVDCQWNCYRYTARRA